MKTKKLKPVIVVFNDVTSFPPGQWKLEELEPIEIEVIGFLWKKDKDKVILKKVKNHYEDEPFVIPTGCVQRIVYLKED